VARSRRNDAAGEDGALILIGRVRQARRRAVSTARAEALALLSDMGAQTLPGGPLSETGGVFWLSITSDRLDDVTARLPCLGYTSAVDVASPGSSRKSDETVRWRGREYSLRRVYEEDPAALREEAPDRQEFMLPGPDGTSRVVRGYRGTGHTLERRGLPVYDARLLVNLVFSPRLGRLLDPFGGAGGVARQSIAVGWTTFTTDIDPALRLGLSHIGSSHAVADVAALPFGPVFDAIATEPPYDRSVEAMLPRWASEMLRVVKPNGGIAMMCAAWQAPAFRQTFVSDGSVIRHEENIDRKGVAVTVMSLTSV
jgi:hypothetical protein